MSKPNIQSTVRHKCLRFFNHTLYVGLLIFALSLPFGYATAIFYTGVSLAILGWIGSMICERRVIWQRTPLDLPILLFLGFAFASALFAPHPDASSFRHFWKLVRAILFFYTIVHCRLGSRLKHVIIAIIFAAAVSSALGLWYYANDTGLYLARMGNIGLEFQKNLADKQISEDLRAVLRNHNIPLSETAAIFSVNRADAWEIKDKSRERRYTLRREGSALSVYMIEQRLAGTFKAPNDLGGYLTLLLPLTMGYFVANRHTRQKQRKRVVSFFLGSALVMMSATLALTLTRSAWVGVTAATLFIAFYLVKNVEWEIKSMRMWIYISLILLPLCATPFLIPRHITGRFQTMIEQPSGFLKGRPEFWQAALGLIQKYPMTGIGLGRFHHEYQLHTPANSYPAPPHAHQIYLQIAVEQGIPSLILFLWMLILIGRKLYDMRQHTGFWNVGVFVGTSGAFISALIYGFGDNLLQQRPLLIFWFMGGLIFYPQLHVNIGGTPPEGPVQLEKKYEKTPEPG